MSRAANGGGNRLLLLGRAATRRAALPRGRRTPSTRRPRTAGRWPSAPPTSTATCCPSSTSPTTSAATACCTTARRPGRPRFARSTGAKALHHAELQGARPRLVQGHGRRLRRPQRRRPARHLRQQHRRASTRWRRATSSASAPASRQRMRDGVAPYVDRSEPLGLSRSGWGWDARLADFDNDGVLEALQATGFVRGDDEPLAGAARAGDGQRRAAADHPAAWQRFRPGDDLSGHDHNPFFVRGRDGRYYDLAARARPRPSRRSAAASPSPTSTATATSTSRSPTSGSASFFYRNDAAARRVPGLACVCRCCEPAAGRAGGTGPTPGRPRRRGRDGPPAGRPAAGRRRSTAATATPASAAPSCTSGSARATADASCRSTCDPLARPGGRYGTRHPLRSRRAGTRSCSARQATRRVLRLAERWTNGPAPRRRCGASPSRSPSSTSSATRCSASSSRGRSRSSALASGLRARAAARGRRRAAPTAGARASSAAPHGARRLPAVGAHHRPGGRDAALLQRAAAGRSRSRRVAAIGSKYGLPRAGGQRPRGTSSTRRTSASRATLLLFPWVGIAPPYHVHREPDRRRRLAPAGVIVVHRHVPQRAVHQAAAADRWPGWAASSLQAWSRQLPASARRSRPRSPDDRRGVHALHVLHGHRPGDDAGAAARPGRLRRVGGRGATALLMALHIVFGLFFALTLVCAVARRCCCTSARGLGGARALPESRRRPSLPGCGSAMSTGHRHRRHGLPLSRTPGSPERAVGERARAAARVPAHAGRAAAPRGLLSSDPRRRTARTPPRRRVIEGYEFDRVRFRVAGRHVPRRRPRALAGARRRRRGARRRRLPGRRRAARATRTGVLVGNTLTGEFSRADLLRLRWPYVRRVVDAALRRRRLGPRPDARDFLRELEERYKAPFPPVGEETLAGGLSNTIAGRICNHFDLHGGGYTVDGACASSLLAVAHGVLRARGGRPRRRARRRRRPQPRPVRAGRLREGRRARRATRCASTTRARPASGPGEGCGFVC